jgi:hypothetical protein
MSTLFRASAPFAVSQPQLGPLAELPGTWVGNGFNLISLPDHQGGKPFRLKLNATREVLTFAPVGGPIPNRGSAQNDIEFLGLHYLQQVSDAPTNAALHLEPGLWLNVPSTTAPADPPTVVRMGTVPHGDALLAQGNFLTIPGPPQIAPVSTKPVAIPPTTIPSGYLDPFKPSNTPPPPGIPPDAIADPNLVLRNAIQGQHITNTTALIITSSPAGGIVNIPFVVKNADVTRMNAIFWIETVDAGGGNTFLQLQYTQTVILNFLGIDWPHVSVATLVKQ